MFKVFQERDAEGEETGQWYWHLTGANNEVVAVSEAYTREVDAIRGAYDAVDAFASSVKPVVNNEVEEKQ